MAEKNKNRKNQKNEIQEIGITKDTLTGRGGLAFIVKFIKKIRVLPLIAQAFQGVRKSRKGKEIEKILAQLIYNAIDGSKQTMTRFDELKDDQGYQRIIETSQFDMVSSHIMKRFFSAVTTKMLNSLQEVLLRLYIAKPEVIILGADTMVLDNNDAKTREGVNITYKLVKGYHPLFIYWGSFIVNMVFHEGKDHPNHNNDFFQALRKTIRTIRKEYDKEKPILVLSDTGFYDEKYFQEMDEQKVFFICGGRLMDCVKMVIMKEPPSKWAGFEKNNTAYDYLDFTDKRESWNKVYRAIYYKQADINGELHLEFDRPETLVYTNLQVGMLLEKYKVMEKYLDGKEIVSLYQARAKDELVNRSMKEFSEEALPFKRFESNGAYYYLEVIASNLLRAFQEDVLSPVIPMTAYPNTVRRLFIDIAGKIVLTARKIILKFEWGVYERLKLPEIWNICTLCVPIIALKIRKIIKQ